MTDLWQNMGSPVPQQGKGMYPWKPKGHRVYRGGLKLEFHICFLQRKKHLLDGAQSPGLLWPLLNCWVGLAASEPKQFWA
jgi:hypothetical protein